jgi:hypothetical protein
MNPAIQGRIFLVACPSSGTTLLQSLLASHPQIASFPETQFFLELTEQLERRLFGTQPLTMQNRLENWLSDCRVSLGIASPKFRYRVNKFLDDIGRPEWRKTFPWRGRWMKQKTQAFIDILDTLALEQQKPYWLEKSPHHLSYIDIIEKYVPDPKFIHLVRNGQDVIASMYQAVTTYPDWGERYRHSLDYCIQQWIWSLQLTQNQWNKPNHALVSYETLVANPQAVLQDLAAFIGVEFQDIMLQGYQSAAKQVVLDNESWKAEVYRPIHNANSQKFYQVFDEQQQRYVRERLAVVNYPEWVGKSE